MSDYKKVEVVVQLVGNYCAYHEMSEYIVYDVTQNIKLDDYTIEELEELLKEGYYWACDYKKCNALLHDGKYFVDIGWVD